jgi:hypothetical protein
MNDDGVLQVVHNEDRSVEIYTVYSGNDFVLDRVPSDSASLADDMDYDFWHAALGHPFKANLNRKLYEYGYVMLDYPSPISCNLYTLSKSMDNIPNPVES